LDCSEEGKRALDRAVGLVKSAAVLLQQLDDRLQAKLNEDRDVEVYLRSIKKARGSVDELIEKLRAYMEAR
jgi:hypothetical protein